MKNICRLLILILTAIFAACSSSDNVEGIPAGHGTVSFELVRRNVYMVTSLSTAKTIKVTLVNEKAERIVLPSMELTGTDDMISTKPYNLPVGHYLVESYRCFDIQGDIIPELDVKMTKENTFDIVDALPTEFLLTVQVKNVLTSSNLYNSLYGLCVEVLGSDKSKWPPSWNFEGDGIDGSWAGLEFEWDVATYTPTELIGIVIDGEPEYIFDSETGDSILVSLPEFKHMKKLPSCIANFTTLDGISIRNCDMEELCPELEHSALTSITVVNTKLKSIPDEIGNMKKLANVYLENNALTEFPVCLTRCQELTSFTVINEKITSVPEEIGNWGNKLEDFTMSHTDITSLPDVFDKLYRVSMLVLDGNSKLSTLPATIGMERIPYSVGEDRYTNTGITGLSLDGCGFTSIPDQVKRGRMNYLSMCNNKITSVTKADFDAMPDLETLKLDGNKLSAFPALTNPKLGYLSLRNTGLKRSQVDVSGLPRLSKYYFYIDE